MLRVTLSGFSTLAVASVIKAGNVAGQGKEMWLMKPRPVTMRQQQ